MKVIVEEAEKHFYDEKLSDNDRHEIERTEDVKVYYGANGSIGLEINDSELVSLVLAKKFPSIFEWLLNDEQKKR